MKLRSERVVNLEIQITLLEFLVKISSQRGTSRLLLPCFNVSVKSDPEITLFRSKQFPDTQSNELLAEWNEA